MSASPEAWADVLADPDWGIVWQLGPQIIRADPRAAISDAQLRYWVIRGLDDRRRPEEVQFDLLATDGGHSIRPKPGDRLYLKGDRTVVYKLAYFREERGLGEPTRSCWLLEWPD